MKADILHEPEPKVIETENPPQLTEIGDNPRILFNDALSDDKRLRTVVYDKITKATQHLPNHLGFLIYEAYRPKHRQIHLWNTVMADIQSTYPDDDAETLALRCNRFVANPYKHGSGHQYGCAVDITLINLRTGQELDMGCGLQEFCEKTETASPLITDEQRTNRKLLINTLGKEGLLNYPPEWWHFSYGDRQWAIQTGNNETLYAALPF